MGNESTSTDTNSSSNSTPNILIVSLLVLAVLTAYLFGRIKGIQPASQVAIVPTETTSPTEAVPSESPTVLPSETPSPTKSSTGTVTGKLCYPAEVLPKGKIEAKNTTSGEIVTQEYAGSQAGGKSSYSFDLKPGTYYLRYNAESGSIGYHSETCKTGVETTCTDTNPRVLIAATVETGKTIEAYDLCDFYYSDSTKPSF